MNQTAQIGKGLHPAKEKPLQTTHQNNPDFNKRAPDVQVPSVTVAEFGCLRCHHAHTAEARTGTAEVTATNRLMGTAPLIVTVQRAITSCLLKEVHLE